MQISCHACSILIWVVDSIFPQKETYKNTLNLLHVDKLLDSIYLLSNTDSYADTKNSKMFFKSVLNQ